MPETKLNEIPGAPIKWQHTGYKGCWTTAHLNFHYVLHASRVQGIGKPFFPAPPKGTLFGKAETSNPGYAKSVAALLDTNSRKAFMDSLPAGVRSFFICERKSSKKSGCYSESVMKGFVIGGETIKIVSGKDIARMESDSEIVRKAMQEFRRAGRYVNGRFCDSKETFTFRNCNIRNNLVECKDIPLKPEDYGSIKLIYGMDNTGKIVDAIYVVKSYPVVVLRGDENKKLKEAGKVGVIIHKECPKKPSTIKAAEPKQTEAAVPA